MDVYLVGGAVRDELLGYPVHEKDWVVVGANVQKMEKLGYRPVGKDFPVFLHPKTQEEYALARTERKTAPGYSGFQFYAEPDVTLEQDLARRDLTINAIARDAQGQLVDPFHGQRDIERRILRHVSSAFSEDPVRILRVARFAARYHHLEFKIAPDTLQLMQDMVASGEVDHLVAERVWKELSRALLERHPEVFISTLRECHALARIMPEVDRLFGVPQPPIHHPEVDTGVHTLLALAQAAKLSDQITVRFATLMHDLGKAETPKDQLPSHPQHEIRSLPLIRTLCKRLAVPKDCRDLALLVAQYHTHCHRALELRPATIVKTFDALDAFRRPQRFTEFLLCCEADSRGRTGLEDRPYPQAQFLADALAACQHINVAEILAQGHQGKAIGEQLHAARINAVKRFVNVYKRQEEASHH